MEELIKECPYFNLDEEEELAFEEDLPEDEKEIEEGLEEEEEEGDDSEEEF